MNGIIGRYEKTAQLFDKNATDTNNGYRSSKYITSTGGENSSSNHIITEYIDISSYTHLTCSNVNTQSSVYNCFYDNNYEKISLFRLDEVPKTVEVPNNAKYIRLSVAKSTIDDYMLNEGETALPYAPYGLVWKDIPYLKLETATDVVTSLPVKVYGDGETDISLLLKGNMVQSGTPSPQNPVMPQGTGDRTSNLLNVSISNVIFYNDYPSSTYNHFTITNNVITLEANKAAFFALPARVEENTTYYIRAKTISGGGITYRLRYYSDLPNNRSDNFISTAISTSIVGTYTNTFTTPQDCKYILIELYHDPTVGEQTIGELMVSSSSDYEPYGYKISILKDSSPLPPVYLNESLLLIGAHVDMISNTEKTLEIDKVQVKDLSWGDYDLSGVPVFRSIGTIDKLYGSGINTMLCDSYEVVASRTFIVNNTIAPYNTSTDNRIVVRDDNYSSASAWKEAMGNAWIYFVRKTPVTEQFTLPSIPTTGGEVTLDVDTTVKPSELDLTYHGWHEHQPLKKSGNLLDFDALKNAPSGEIDNVNFPNVLELHLKPNTYYTMSSNGTGSTDGEADANRSVYFTRSTTQYAVFINHKVTITTDDTGIVLIGFFSSRTNAQQYLDGTAVIMLNEGQTALPYEPCWK